MVFYQSDMNMKSLMILFFYECVDNFEIENLTFSKGGTNLSFSLIEFGTDYYDWYLKYNLAITE